MSTSDEIRIGILGASWIAPLAVINPAKYVENVKVAAVAARDSEKAKKYASTHKIPKVHNSYQVIKSSHLINQKELIDDPEINAIYIGLPNNAHCEWSIKALQAGKHVLCEKPVASNAEEAVQIQQALQEVNQNRTTALQFMEAFHYRHHPLAKRLKQLVDYWDCWSENVENIKDSAKLTEMKREVGLCLDFIKSKGISNVDVKMKYPIFKSTDIRWQFELGGGALMDGGCYVINMLRYLIGDDLEVGYTKHHPYRRNPKVDQSVYADIKSPTGISGSLEVSMWSLIPAVSVKVKGYNGAQINVINWVTPQMIYHKFTATDCHGKSISEKFEKGDDQATYTYQLKDFVTAIRTADSSYLITGIDDAVKNMKMIDTVYEKIGLPLRGKI